MTNTLATNNIVINEIAETAAHLTAHTANNAVMQALTDAWNTLTNQQHADFTSNAGDRDYVTVATTLGSNTARLVDDE